MNQQYTTPINQSLKAGVFSRFTMLENHLKMSHFDCFAVHIHYFKFDIFSKLIVGVMDVILQSLQYVVANDSSGSISHHGHYVDNDRAPLRPPNHRSRVYRMKKRKSRADDKIETFLYSQAIAASYNTRKHHPNVSSKKVHSDTVAVSVYPLLRKPPPQYRLDQYSSRPLVLFSDRQPFLSTVSCHTYSILGQSKVCKVFWVIQAFESESNNEGEE